MHTSQWGNHQTHWAWCFPLWNLRKLNILQVETALQSSDCILWQCCRVLLGFIYVSDWYLDFIRDYLGMWHLAYHVVISLSKKTWRPQGNRRASMHRFASVHPPNFGVCMSNGSVLRVFTNRRMDEQTGPKTLFWPLMWEVKSHNYNNTNIPTIFSPTMRVLCPSNGKLHSNRNHFQP